MVGLYGSRDADKTIETMSVRFDVAVKYSPRLGPDEQPYALLVWIGGLEHTVVSKKLIVVPGHADKPLLSFDIPKPAHIAAGEPFLPADAALMCVALIATNSADDKHKHKLGVNEAGTACFPLRQVLRSSQGSAVATQALRVYNAMVADSHYTEDKGELKLTFGQLKSQAVEPFLPENEYTVDHEAELQNPLIQAVIQASMHFGQNSTCRFQAIAELPGLPPYQFHRYFIPGQMLAAKRNHQPMTESWWKKLVDMGIQRAHPDLSANTAKLYLSDMGTERDKMAALVSAWVTPCNYWRYYPDQTETRDGKYVQMECFGITSRAKCGIVGDKLYSPLQDCEDDEEDIQKLAVEFQNTKIQQFKDPLLKELQGISQNYVVLQALCGVNGAQVSDGRAAQSDPYANLGGHEVSVVMRKSTFVKLLGRLNKSRPLFKGWAEDYDPDAAFSFPEDQPFIGEGTGDVDPVGGGYRSNLLDGYRYLMLGNSNKASTAFENWKLVQWQDPTKINEFYRCFLSFVVPELYDQGFTNASFTAMSVNKEGKWERGFSYNDLMRPHAKIALRTDPAMTETQARTVKRVASFYPPIHGFKSPGPAAECPARSKLQQRMQSIVDTMQEVQASRTTSGKTLVADFYPTYYQLEKERIDAICQLIREKKQIVNVSVTEEAIHEGLGGYRIAFTIDMTTNPQRLIQQVGSQTVAPKWLRWLTK